VGYGVNGSTHRIELKEFDGSDNWVDIKSEMSNATRTRIKEAAVTLAGVNGDLSLVFNATVNLTETRIRLFEGTIVDWSLKASDDDPMPMPRNRTTYTDVLTGDVADFLDGAISAYYEARKLKPEAASD
jgi:hypothetical protein